MSVNGSEDWIELFLDWTEGIPSPRIYRQWAAISALAGALERRVHIISVGKTLFPNLYILLVGAPGVGKSQAIEHVNQLWTSIPGELIVAPHDVTKAALVDALAKASRRMIIGESHLVEYNSLLVCADEFGVLVPAYDTEFLNTLNRIYDNPPAHQQNRRGLQQQIDIIKPQLNIIGGVQPAYLANLLPETAWSMGFMSRVIMVYSSEKKTVRLNLRSTAQVIRNADMFSTLVAKTKAVLKLHGKLEWTEEAENAIEHWNEKDQLAPIPEHSKLDHYNQRRLQHVLKLSIISSVSRGAPAIDTVDFNRARDWLLEAEQLMPDVFREMVQRSDREVIDELHWYAWKRYIVSKKPIHEKTLIDFLRIRAPSEKIQKILDIAVRAGMFDDVGAGYFMPKPKHEHGIE